MTDLKGNVFFDGPVGRLEGLLNESAGPFTHTAVVCHPHPLYGGTMHNKVVFRIAKAFRQAGFCVLRFNFRGTGLSDGKHDDGRGEQDDLGAAISFLTARYPAADVWAAGFSFGAAVMLRLACKDDRVRALVGAGLAVSRSDFGDVDSCVKPKLLVQGSLDQFGSTDQIKLLFERLSDPKRLRIVEGADHFFDGYLDELEREVLSFVEETKKGS